MVDKINDSMDEQELIRALQDAIEAQPDIEPNTITRQEYADATGLSNYKARKQLRQLMEGGVLEPDYVLRVNDWDERQHIKGYRYVGDS